MSSFIKYKLTAVALSISITSAVNISTPLFTTTQTATFAAPVEIGQSQTFVVSAYYSPLPNQDKYVWGNYEAEKRMNGEGNRGADFTKVYPGMIAAPNTYPYGTKIKIPGFGTGAVHDRGGRILEWKNSDRIDLWMGYGDDGRKRAMQWGIKTVTGTIMPASAKESVQMNFMSKASQTKSAPNKTTQPVNKTVTEQTKTLYLGDKGESVRNLQKFLIRQNLLHVNATGYYGEKTKEAVYQFQLRKNIVSNKNQTGAGVFGPTTRKNAEKVWTQTVPKKTIITSTENLPAKTSQAITIHNISDSTEKYNPDYAVIKPNLQLGDKGEAVKRLQLVLKGMNYYSGAVTSLYDKKTVEAVYAYQISKKIVSNKNQKGAGRFGPQTYSMMVNTLLQKRNLISTQKTNPLASDWSYITAEQIAMRKQKIHVATLNVEFGEKSTKVKNLQNELIARGFLDPNLNTGYYGNKTKAAIGAYKAFIG